MVSVDDPPLLRGFFISPAHANHPGSVVFWPLHHAKLHLPCGAALEAARIGRPAAEP